MSLVVLDTNVLVSSLWNQDGLPSKVVKMVMEKQVTACYDYGIINEYNQVLFRPKFAFSPSDVLDLLNFIQSTGFSVIAKPSSISFSDESDRKFYDVAKACNAFLVTGNKRRFPLEHNIVTPFEFINKEL